MVLAKWSIKLPRDCLVVGSNPVAVCSESLELTSLSKFGEKVGRDWLNGQHNYRVTDWS